MEQKPPRAHLPNAKIDSIALAHPQERRWSVPPGFRPDQYASDEMPATPSFLAKAPNSRAGLTDENVPGAYPFIPPVKRQSARLSKPPPGHCRSKSGRSSKSARGVWSYAGGAGPNTESRTNDGMRTWFDAEDNDMRRKRESRTTDKMTMWLEEEYDFRNKRESRTYDKMMTWLYAEENDSRNKWESRTYDKMAVWVDQEGYDIRKELTRTDRASSSAATSIFDGFDGGGLSPRPKSHLRPWKRNPDMGRATS
jgi:hypothetical protein